MAKKTVDMSMLSGVGSSARLIEKEATPAAATKSKLLTGLPVAFEERHKALKLAGVTSLLLNPYIIEALREKLERDEQRT
ncbi:MAG: chaperonin [Plesiomonas shigelloides]